MLKTSVLSVTHDGEDAHRLDTYFASLANQTRVADEVILILDGEIRKELHDVIDQWQCQLRLKVISSDKKGFGSCLNTGLLHCTGEIVFRADTDDVNLPNRFAEQEKILLNNHLISVTSAPIVEIWKNGLEVIKSVPSGTTKPWSLYSFFRNPVNHNCSAYRTADVLAIGGYPTRQKSITQMEDYHLWVKLLIHSKRFFGSREVLLRADARELLARRSGNGWFLAEVELMKLNAQRMAYCGSVLAIVAFALRAFLIRSLTRRLRIGLYKYFLRRRVQSRVVEGNLGGFTTHRYPRSLR